MCIALHAAGGRVEPIKYQSLRGAEIDASDPEGDGTVQRDTAPLPRDFVQQPPLIPRTTRATSSARASTSASVAHAWSRAKESGATRISVTHFRTREGVELSSVSPNRYFCNQCHVPSGRAAPLVGNTFKPGAEPLRPGIRGGT